MMNRVANGYECLGGNWMIMGSTFLFWIAIILSVLLLFKYVQKNHLNDDKALQILNQRLAKSEIEVDEYDKIKSILMK